MFVIKRYGLPEPKTAEWSRCFYPDLPESWMMIIIAIVIAIGKVEGL